ncbi:GNAT family N-acetyltransferase [Clostridium estertheticum]|uniref:GNAT family N-acetyltransferase n=1 Tax=Clostridium estertheticum TaxID=238834 RepID=UPI0013E95FA5|nr:GNAT family N-acetyltransferase [Clostridium estertheticum]MBZ9685562.1 GNAT family N-acetyltransferase [Clostridium estertheticum]
MNFKIELNYLNGEKQAPYLATISDIEQENINHIIMLHPIIKESLESINDFYFDDYDFYKHHLDKGGKILGCYVNDTLVAYGVLIFPGFDNDNLGYDFNLSKDELLKVAHLDSVAVHPDYRGNKLQYILFSLLEKISIEKGYKYLCSTVSPTNKFSLNNLLKLGLEIKIEKEKYDEKNRLILYKSLGNM